MYKQFISRVKKRFEAALKVMYILSYNEMYYVKNVRLTCHCSECMSQTFKLNSYLEF